MQKIFFAIILFLFSSVSTSFATEFEIEVPKFVFSDIATRVEISTKNGNLPEYVFQQRGGKLVSDTLFLDTTAQKASIDLVFFNNEQIELKGHSIKNNTAVGVVPLWMSILPPLFAIFLALVFKEVVFSLVTGIFIGAAIMGFYAEGFIGIFTGFFRVIDTYVMNALNDYSHLAVIVFSILIGGIVALISKNGGMQGIVNRVSRIANSVRNGQLATLGLGIIIFFDDYANTLVVGNTMRAITDKLRISREKLAYIVDSTAAPVSAVAFVTTWIGAELGYISDGLNTINANGTEVTEGVYSIFLNSLAYSFYPIFTIFFIFYIVMRGKDFGPMLKAEQRARKGNVVNPEVNQGDLTEMENLKPIEGIKYRSRNAIIPVAIIVLGTIFGLMYTGFESLRGQILAIDSSVKVNSWSEIWSNITMIDPTVQGFTKKLGTLIGASDSYLSLLWASLSSLLAAVLLTVGQKIMNLQHSVETVISGFKSMIPALMILVLAWSLAGVTDDMHTADFLTRSIGDSIPPWLIPALTFVLASLISFSTGSSWSTMALVYPLILPAAWAICQSDIYQYSDVDSMAIFYNTVSAVLAGSVLGDHCSPISDTTILSSLSSGSNHIDHVRTQMPYALFVGIISVVIGSLLTGLGMHPVFAIIGGMIAIMVIVELIGKRAE